MGMQEKLTALRRPDIDGKAYFRDGLQVRPGLALKHSDERGVIDASLIRRGTQAFFADCGTEVEDELPGDLTYRVRGRGFGPRRRGEILGFLSLRAGHGITVDEAAGCVR